MTRKRIGCTSPYLPSELIRACGFTPVRLRPGEGLAAVDGYLPRTSWPKIPRLTNARSPNRSPSNPGPRRCPHR